LVYQRGNPRGKDSTMRTVKQAIEQAGGDYAVVQDLANAQAGSSWSSLSQALKYYLIEHGKGKPDDYYWQDGYEGARRHYEQAVKHYGEEKFKKSFDAYYAFTQEMLDTIDLPNVDRKRRTVTLWRTEARSVTQGHTPGETGVSVKRGAAESTSLLNPVYALSSARELTRQEVPFADIIGTYLPARDLREQSFFLSDSENEFVVMLGLTPFEYISSRRR
jgi:hypothetical protein